MENIQKQTASGMFVLKGTLSIAGISQKLDITSAVKQVGGTYTLKGSKEIKLQDFNIEPPTAMFGQIVVGESVTIQFDTIFTKG